MTDSPLSPAPAPGSAPSPGRSRHFPVPWHTPRHVPPHAGGSGNRPTPSPDPLTGCPHCICFHSPHCLSSPHYSFPHPALAVMLVRALVCSLNQALTRAGTYPGPPHCTPPRGKWARSIPRPPIPGRSGNRPPSLKGSPIMHRLPVNPLTRWIHELAHRLRCKRDPQYALAALAAAQESAAELAALAATDALALALAQVTYANAYRDTRRP